MRSIVALATVMLLAGCASPAPLATPAPTPTAIDHSPAIIDVTAQVVSIEAQDGTVLDTFAFTDDSATAVDLLTGLLGTPEVTEVPGLEQPAYTDYNWSGFELHVLAAGSAPYPPLRVKVSVTSVADLLVTTIDGLSIGVSADAVAERYPESTLTFTPPGAAPRYAVTLGQEDGFSVGLEGEVGGPITSMVAPQLG